MEQKNIAKDRARDEEEEVIDDDQEEVEEHEVRPRKLRKLARDEEYWS